MYSISWKIACNGIFGSSPNSCIVLSAVVNISKEHNALFLATKLDLLKWRVCLVALQRAVNCGFQSYNIVQRAGDDLFMSANHIFGNHS